MQRRILAAALAVASLGLAACGSSQPGTPTNPTTTSTAPTSSTTRPPTTTTSTTRPPATTTTRPATTTTSTTAGSERERREALRLGTVEPNASNTGVLPDVARTPAASEIVTLSTEGQTYENKDVPCQIRIRAKSVTVRNVRVRGVCSTASGQPGSGASLINATHAAVDDAVIEHVTLKPDTPRPDWNGVNGHDFTLRFVDISHTVDGVGVWNTNGPKGVDGKYLPYRTGVVIRQSYIHDLSWFTGPAPGVVHPSDTETHNDDIQHQGGTHSIIEGNTLVGRFARQTAHWRSTTTSEPYTSVALGSLPGGGPHQALPDRGNGTEANGRYNWDDIACLMIGDEVGPTYELTFNGNWCYGGNYAVNGGGNAIYNGTVRIGEFLRNRFDRAQGAQSSGGDNTHTINLGQNWAGRVESGAGTADANRYMDNGHEINFRGD
jgi:hypothetical protein